MSISFPRTPGTVPAIHFSSAAEKTNKLQELDPSEVSKLTPDVIKQNFRDRAPEALLLALRYKLSHGEQLASAAYLEAMEAPAKSLVKEVVSGILFIPFDQPNRPKVDTLKEGQRIIDKYIDDQEKNDFFIAMLEEHKNTSECTAVARFLMFFCTDDATQLKFKRYTSFGI